MKTPVHRNIRLLTWFNFCLDFRLYDAVAIIYFAKVSGSFALGLAVFSINTVTAALFQVPTGVLSDRVGRKATLILGSLGTITSVICYAIAPSFRILALGGFIEGIAYALYSGNNSALTYDSLKEEGKESRFAEFEGKLSSMFQFALATSALLGSLVLGLSSFRWIFWISVIPQVIGLTFALRIIEPKRFADEPNTNIFSHLRESLRKFKENSKLRTLSLAQVLDYSIGESMHQFSPVFIATLWPVWAIGLARVLSHLFAAAGFRLGGKFSKKLGELKVLLIGDGTSSFLGILVVAFPTVVTPVVNAFTSFPFGTSHVALNSLLQKEFSDKQRATMASFNSLFGSLAFGVFALLLGVYADHVGPRWALLTAQILGTATIFLYLKLFKKERAMT